MAGLSLALVVSVVAAAPEDASAKRLEIRSALIAPVEQVDVPAREAGVLGAVNVREGQMVEQGELLAQIVDIEARTEAERARFELQIARKNAENDVNVRFARKSVEVARAELRRSMDSIQKYPKAISDSEMDRLRLVVDRAELEVEQAERDFQIAAVMEQIKENEYRSAQQKVERHKITAPINGVVVQVNRHRGEWVQPGETVVRILRLDALRVEGFLDASFLGYRLEDCPAEVRVDLADNPGARFSGKVVFVSPEIDPVNAQIRIWAEIDNRQLRLRPGMRADMTIELRPKRQPK